MLIGKKRDSKGKRKLVSYEFETIASQWMTVTSVKKKIGICMLSVSVDWNCEEILEEKKIPTSFE